MKLKTLFTINAVVFVVLGLPNLLAPGPLFSLWGIEVTEVGAYSQRFWAAAVLGLAALAWFVRTTEESEARRAIILALMVTWALHFVVALVGTASGVLPALEWPFVALYLLFALGYGYFLFVKPSAS